MSDLLQAERLAKTFRGPNGPVAVFADLDLTLAAGDFLAVTGASGSGKSTLLLLLGGLLAPDRGRVRVAGDDLYALGPGARARARQHHLGFVFQRFHLLPYGTVVENIAAAGIGTGLPSAEARERAETLASMFGLEHRLDHRPDQLSVGEQQRTALARALFNRPRLLLADEPTGNLDQANADTVLAALADFAAAGGAVLLVTHDQRAAAAATSHRQLTAGRLAAAPRPAPPALAPPLVMGGLERP